MEVPDEATSRGCRGRHARPHEHRRTRRARTFGAVYANDATYRVFGNAANVPDGTGTDPFAKFTNSTNADQFGVAEFAPGSPTGHHGGRWAVYRATWISGDLRRWYPGLSSSPCGDGHPRPRRGGRLPLPRPRQPRTDRLRPTQGAARLACEVAAPWPIAAAYRSRVAMRCPSRRSTHAEAGAESDRLCVWRRLQEALEAFSRLNFRVHRLLDRSADARPKWRYTVVFATSACATTASMLVEWMPCAWKSRSVAVRIRSRADARPVADTRAVHFIPLRRDRRMARRRRLP